MPIEPLLVWEAGEYIRNLSNWKWGLHQLCAALVHRSTHNFTRRQDAQRSPPSQMNPHHAMGHFTLPAISISIRKQKDDLSPGSAEVSSLSSLCSEGGSELIGRRFVCYRRPQSNRGQLPIRKFPPWQPEKVNRKT